MDKTTRLRDGKVDRAARPGDSAGSVASAGPGSYDNFLELGGNSISGAMLAFHLQEALGEDIHAIIIFDAPTGAELSRFLAVRFPDRVMEAWGAESLPESVQQAILEMVAYLDEEGLEKQENEPTVTGVQA